MVFVIDILFVDKIHLYLKVGKLILGARLSVIKSQVQEKTKINQYANQFVKLNL